MTRRLSDGTRNMRAQRMIQASRTALFRQYPRRAVVDRIGTRDFLACGHLFFGRDERTSRHCYKCFAGMPVEHDLLESPNVKEAR